MIAKQRRKYMENATKALEMAGSVLIGVLLLGCILFAYSHLSTIKKEGYSFIYFMPSSFPLLWQKSPAIQ